MRKFFLVALTIVLVAIIEFVVLNFVLPNNKFSIEDLENPPILLNNPKKQLDNEKLEDPKIIFLAVGDIMLDRGVEWQMEKYEDFKLPFLKIADDLKEADILFGNLESVISDKGRKVGSIYSFRAKPETLNGLTTAGFNVVSAANNHIFDYGREAMEDSLQRLEKANIDYIGAGFNEKEAFSVKIKEIKGTKIGFMAYANLGPESWRAKKENSGIAWIQEKDFEKIKEDIKSAKEKTDILIISLHSGQEYNVKPTSFQKKFSQQAIEAGADLIIGHHPHIIQPIENIKTAGSLILLEILFLTKAFLKKLWKVFY